MALRVASFESEEHLCALLLCQTFQLLLRPLGIETIFDPKLSARPSPLHFSIPFVGHPRSALAGASLMLPRLPFQIPRPIGRCMTPIRVCDTSIRNNLQGWREVP